MVNYSTFFGPVACLAAALGPLAAELDPLACFKSYWFLFIIINSVLCVFRFINLWWLISSCVKYESKNITKANWMFSDYVFPLNILLVYKRKKTLLLTEYLSVTKKWSHNWLFNQNKQHCNYFLPKWQKTHICLLRTHLWRHHLLSERTKPNPRIW